MTTGQPGQDDTKPETQRLLTAANYFLQNRNFADCCKYAARARDSDPTNPAPIQFLSIASVLSVPSISSAHRNYYALLNLPYFDKDAPRIESSFKALASILDPKSNPRPFSLEAFDLVLKAWSVLSNPLEKERFDNELRMKLTGGGTSINGGGTFWTMCPYCYYVYEYDKVFEDCCLRCDNERCRRLLHAVAIGAPPPPDVVEKKGQYLCPGFMPFAIGNSYGEKLWMPFSPATATAASGCKGDDHNLRCEGIGEKMCMSFSPATVASGGKGDDHNLPNGEKLWMPFFPATAASGGEGDDHNLPSDVDYVKGDDHNHPSDVDYVVLSDDETVEGEEFQNHCDGGEKLETVCENAESVCENATEKGVNENEVRMERRKSVPWKSKKVMGRGIRIDRNEAEFIYGFPEEEQSNADDLGGEMLTNVESVVEFFAGEDDVFIGLPSDFDLQNGLL